MPDESGKGTQRLRESAPGHFEKLDAFEQHVLEIKEALAEFHGAMKKGGNDLAQAANHLKAAVANAERVADAVRDHTAKAPAKEFWRGAVISAVASLALVAGGYFAGMKEKSGDIAERCAWIYTPTGQIASALTLELQKRGIEPNPQDTQFKDWVAWSFSPQGLRAFQQSIVAPRPAE